MPKIAPDTFPNGFPKPFNSTVLNLVSLMRATRGQDPIITKMVDDHLTGTLGWPARHTADLYKRPRRPCGCGCGATGRRKPVRIKIAKPPAGPAAD